MTLLRPSRRRVSGSGVSGPGTPRGRGGALAAGRRRAVALLAGALLAAAPMALAAAEESGGIAALGFSLPGLVAQLINFLILMVVLRLFLYKPLMKMLDERRKRIQEGLDRAEEAVAGASSSEEEARRIVEQARVEGREAVTMAQEAAQRLRGELEERARQDADQILERAREELQAERDRALQELRQQFADLTVIAAERVLGQAIDGAAHRRLIDEVLVESGPGDGQPEQRG